MPTGLLSVAVATMPEPSAAAYTFLALCDRAGTFGQLVHARDVQHDGLVYGTVGNGDTGQIPNYAHLAAF